MEPVLVLILVLVASGASWFLGMSYSTLKAINITLQHLAKNKIIEIIEHNGVIEIYSGTQTRMKKYMEE